MDRFQSLNRFWIRRFTYGTVTVCILTCLLRINRRFDETLRHDVFFTGYLLCGAILFLALFNLRKRLSFFPAGSASTWLQVHIYVGLAAIVVFQTHVSWRTPQGVLETALYISFGLTSLSGLIGLYWTRTIPARLTKLREQVIFERIPLLRQHVANQTHEIVLKLLRDSPAEAIVDWYKLRLVHYLIRPRGWWYYVAPSSGLRNELHRELAVLTRYFSDTEQVASADLKRMIDHRDDLDYQDAQQRWLKYWLFVHLGLSSVLIVLMLVHLVMVHAFTGWT